MEKTVNGFSDSLGKIESVLGSNMETVERLVKLKEKMMKFNAEKNYEVMKPKDNLQLAA